MNQRDEKEKKYLDKIQIHLERLGYEVQREVIPDECKDWKQPYRVDMIIYRHDCDYIGVEGKFLNTIRQGSKISQALLQIVRYRKLTYFGGRKINNWTITYDTGYHINNNTEDIKIFLINFLITFNIKLLVFKEYYDKEHNYVSLNPGLKGSKRL